MKKISIYLAFIAATVYFVWRFVNLPPFLLLDIQVLWIYLVFVVELLSYNTGLLYLFLKLKSVNRRQEISEYRRQYQNKKHWPAVDVFITTYNEPLDILKQTIKSAKELDYSNFKIFVLDDGNRSELKEYCEREGVEHITRNDNLNAKAGNLNNGLLYSSGDFVAIVDADFAVFPSFLKKGIPVFEDKTVGIVQFPHHFANLDIFEHKLGMRDELGDEQRFWFDDILITKDAWDVATSCGSMSIVRKEYLENIGGKFPDDTITEDFDLSLRFLEIGIVTRYINERHGIGLCADDTDSFFRQRQRWATGNLDVWLHHFKRGKYFSIGKYLLAFDWYYLVQIPSKIFLMFVPLIFLIFGLVPLYVDSWYELVLFHLPFVILNVVALNINSRNKYVPIITDAVSQTCCVAIAPSLTRHIIGFKDSKFHVTAKGKVKRKANTLTVIYRRFVELLILLYVVFLPYRILIDGLYNNNIWYIVGFWGTLSILTLYVMRKLLKDDDDKHISEKIGCGKRQSHRLRKSKLASISKVFS